MTTKNPTAERPKVTVSACTANSTTIEAGNIFMILTDQGEDGFHLKVQSNGQKVTVMP